MKCTSTLLVFCMGSNGVPFSMCSRCLCPVITCTSTAAEPYLWNREEPLPTTVCGADLYSNGFCYHDVLPSSCCPQPFLPFHTVRLLPLLLFIWREILMYSCSLQNPKTISKWIPRAGKSFPPRNFLVYTCPVLTLFSKYLIMATSRNTTLG